MQNRTVHVISGGTVLPVRAHCSLFPGGYGETGIRIADLCKENSSAMDVHLHLTRPADPRNSRMETNEDVFNLVKQLVADPLTKVIIFNAAIMDFEGQIDGVPSGKHAKRLRTRGSGGQPLYHEMRMRPMPKIVNFIRREGIEGRPPRKDIVLVSFKATDGETEEEQYLQGLEQLKRSSSNFVLANDTGTKMNMVIVPEEAAYHVTKDREEALRGLVKMVYHRSHLTFTQSTPGPAEDIPWDSPLVPAALRRVVNHCIWRRAYKPFLGSTAGHFAVKLDDTTFLSTKRKTNLNDIDKIGMVKIKTDGPDTVIAYGAKPSVGGQSQRIVFRDHPGTDCIVHFHCPIKPDSKVPVRSQREYECGSHQCGQNTSDGLAPFGNLLAVYLDQHGPNVVFHHSIDPQEVIDFIETNFDLESKTGGYQLPA